MEWIKKVSSLWTRGRKLQMRKVNGSTGLSKSKIIGVSLQDLIMTTYSHAEVPFVVQRICEFIYKSSLNGVDLFKLHEKEIKMIAKLHKQFESTGDANLEENNVAAAVGFLQFFLLNLPDTLIPSRQTDDFFSLLKDPHLDKEAVVNRLKSALSLLPKENYIVLKYISCWLAALIVNETCSKLSATSLIFLLGPTVFRCVSTSSTDQLNDTDCSKVIMHLFASKYDNIFLEIGDPTPSQFWVQCFMNDTSCMRFPPPKVQSLPTFAYQSVECINLLLASSRSMLSLHQHFFPAACRVEEKQKTFMQSLHSMDTQELPTAEDKNNKNETCTDNQNEDTGQKCKTKPLCVNDNRALTLQTSSSLHLSLEHLSSRQSSPSPSSSSSSSVSGSSMLDGSPCGVNLFIPPLDLSTLHEHMNSVEPIPMSLEQLDTHLWIKANCFSSPEDADVAIVSPRSYKLIDNFDWTDTAISDVCEAPMSPSAYYDSGLFRAPLNTDIPPSPLIQQDVYRKERYDDCNYRLKQLSIRIQDLKKKIKNFEEGFERDHGYKPSQGQKSADPDMKKYMNELSRARKSIKHLKEDTDRSNRHRHSCAFFPSVVETKHPDTHSLTVTLEIIHRHLKEKRQHAGKPEELTLMSREQLQEEKLALQGALLHLEKLHGKPATCEEKDLIKPLYDRYRSVKRMLIKPLSPCASLELQTVPEDHMMEIPLSFNRDSISVFGTYLDQEVNGSFCCETANQEMTDFVKSKIPVIQVDSPVQTDTGDKVDNNEETEGASHLHEMNLSQLHVEMEHALRHKKKLKRALREFEMDFFCKNGRRILKEDKHLFQNGYHGYKKVKAHIRLLEALIFKHCE